MVSRGENKFHASPPHTSFRGELIGFDASPLWNLTPFRHVFKSPLNSNEPDMDIILLIILIVLLGSALPTWRYSAPGRSRYYRR